MGDLTNLTKLKLIRLKVFSKLTTKFVKITGGKLGRTWRARRRQRWRFRPRRWLQRPRWFTRWRRRHEERLRDRVRQQAAAFLRRGHRGATEEHRSSSWRALPQSGNPPRQDLGQHRVSRRPLRHHRDAHQRAAQLLDAQRPGLNVKLSFFVADQPRGNLS